MILPIRISPIVIWVLLGLVAFFLPRNRIFPSLNLILLSFIFILAILPVGRWLAAPLVIKEPLPKKADAIYILGSSMQADQEFTAVSLSRLLKGIEIAASGISQNLIISEISGHHPGYEKATKRLVQNLRLREINVINAGEIRNTFEEGLLLKDIFNQRGWKDLIIVTSPIHTLRSLKTFRSWNKNAYVAVAPQTKYDIENLNSINERLSIIGPILHEYIGLAYYKMRGRF